MTRFFVPASLGILVLVVLILAFFPAEAFLPAPAATTPTFDPARLAQPPTVFPPAQADNGAQLYWGMCMDCHGDRGQGLTGEWRASFPPEQQDCWQSGCHGPDFPSNSFMIPATGAPPLAGAGTLARFANALEMQVFILQNMPLFPPGSLTGEQAWSLTAYLLRLNGQELDGLILDETNAAAIPLRGSVSVPGSGIPGAFLLAGALGLAALTLGLRAARARPPASGPAPRPNFVAHLHPPRIPAAQARFRYTLGAGGLSVFFSLVLLVTGLLEMYYYVPTPEEAAVSIQAITSLVPFGGLVRGLHYWSAQFLVIAMTVHLLRVALTGAYAPPRRGNYLIGLGLFVLILLLDFTGYVLRWDEGIRWALVVGANLLRTIPGIGEGLYRFVVGGSEPGAATLTRFYAWHIFGLALGTLLLIVWHAFRVRRDGGIAAPPQAAGLAGERISRADLLRREVLAMLVAGGLLLVFAALVPAPLDRPLSDTGVLAGDSRAPWFFLWVQQLLVLGDPFLWGVLTPVLVFVVLGLLPYVLPNAKADELGRWLPRRGRAGGLLTAAIIAAIFLLTVLGALAR